MPQPQCEACCLSKPGARGWGRTNSCEHAGSAAGRQTPLGTCSARLCSAGSADSCCPSIRRCPSPRCSWQEPGEQSSQVERRKRGETAPWRVRPSAGRAASKQPPCAAGVAGKAPPGSPQPSALLGSGRGAPGWPGGFVGIRTTWRQQERLQS